MIQNHQTTVTTKHQALANNGNVAAPITHIMLENNNDSGESSDKIMTILTRKIVTVTGKKL
jgi:hypothetical protein